MFRKSNRNKVGDSFLNTVGADPKSKSTRYLETPLAFLDFFFNLARAAAAAHYRYHHQFVTCLASTDTLESCSMKVTHTLATAKAASHYFFFFQHH